MNVRLRCNICGTHRVLQLRGLKPKLVCSNCDKTDQSPKGTRNDGGLFGDMLPEQAKFDRKRNHLLAEMSGNYKGYADSLFRCKSTIKANAGGFSSQAQIDFQNLFDLANMGLYYSCVQLKETAQLLVDSGMIKPSDDPWELNKPKGGSK